MLKKIKVLWLLLVISLVLPASMLWAAGSEEASPAKPGGAGTQTGVLTGFGAKGLIGSWKFDEGKGITVDDSSGNNNNGTIHGATWVKGQVGGALEFNGTDNYVVIPGFAALNNLKAVTMMAWIKSSLSTRHTIIERWLYGGKTNERSLVLTVGPASKGVSFGLKPAPDTGGGGFLGSIGHVPTDGWAYIAVTSDGQKMKIYIDGVQDPRTKAAPGKIKPSTANLNIGGWYAEGEWSEYFKGIIDEVSIYSRALTAEEILKYYQMTSTKGSVEGKVSDAASNPLAGAQVQVGPFSVTTDAGGNYSLPEVPIGIYQVTAIKRAYSQKIEQNVEVEAGGNTVLNFKLETDTTAPVISGVKSKDVASLSAWVVWETDGPANSLVRFGTASGRYTGKVSDPVYATGHSIALTGLSPVTTYYFVAGSTDRAENPAQSREQSFTTGRLGGMIIWDTNKKYRMKRPTRFAMDDRQKWTQVPYGMTGDSVFRGDPMIGNKYLQLFLFYNKSDSVNLAAKLEDGGLSGNEIYKVYDDKNGRRNFGMGTVYTRILKNTPDEMVVEHAGYSRRMKKNKMVTIYTMQADKPWLKVLPKKWVNQQGMHGKTRIIAFVLKNGGEVIFDSKREPWNGKERNIQAPEGTIGIINFRRHWTTRYDFMWFLGLSPGAEKDRRTYVGFHSDPFNGEEVSPNRPSVGAQYVYMDKDKPAVIAALRYKSDWTRENVGKPIKAGESYVSSFSAPYPGKWRLIGRVVSGKQGKYPAGTVELADLAKPYSSSFTQFLKRGKYYSSTVNVTGADVAAGKKFTFTSGIDGELDYLLIYLRDRNDDTSKDIYTPMDVYREAILGQVNKE